MGARPAHLGGETPPLRCFYRELSSASGRYTGMYMYVTIPEGLPVDMAVVPNPPQVPPKPVNPGDPPPWDLPPARPGDVPPIDPDKPTPPKPL